MTEFQEHAQNKTSDQVIAPLVHVRGIAEQMGWRAERFGESFEGVPLLAWWPRRTPDRIVFAAIHGEESQTLILAHQLLREVRAEDACAVVVPVLNPDGVLHGTRQNARGVDLNRNFPASNWRPDPSPTFPPLTLSRTAADRNQISSPGQAAASEPEVEAIIALVERIGPKEFIGLHAPDECILAPYAESLALAERLAADSNLPIVGAIAVDEAPTDAPGSSNDWAHEMGMAAVSYEIEIAGLARVWHRHRRSLIAAIT